jgi:hypothetical protein
MSNVILKDTNNGNERTFDTVAEAEEQMSKLVGLGADPNDLEITTPDDDATPDGGENIVTDASESVDADVVDHTDAADDLPDEPPVDTDPLTWIPDEFQDRIDGSIAINRKGFEILAHHYDISCETELVEWSPETVIHKATARTDCGTVYTAYGEAHASEDADHQLVRLSDTRAFKRAVSRATGIGMIAVEELQNQL